MIGKKLYQIAAKGQYKSFSSGHGKYYSKNIYLEKPNQEEIDSFLDRCCGNIPPNDLFDLDRNTVEISMVELIVK